MKRHSRLSYCIAGGAAGAANGLFGGGGGSILVPLLIRLCGLESRKAFATSVAVILPLCLLSLWFYVRQGGFDWMTALPYLTGGTLGGWLGGRLFRKANILWLRRGFGLLLVYGGIRSLL